MIKISLESQIKVFLSQFRRISTQNSLNNVKTTEKLEDKKPITNEKVVKIAFIGIPNAGKSTLINSLLDHRICPVSNKVHTTRSVSKAISFRNNSQIIMFDTPGVVTDKEIKKHNLEKGFISSCRNSVQNANLVGVIQDVSNAWTKNIIHPTILQVLEEYPNTPSILVLNKIDALKSKRSLLETVKLLTNNTLTDKINRQYRRRLSPEKIKEFVKENVGWSNFQDVFMVSALTGDGIQALMSYILSQAEAKEWEEHTGSQFSDQTDEEIIVQSVRARLLDYLPQEIPYNLDQQIEFYERKNNQIFASVIVTCPNERIERLVCGESNGKLKQITERATSDLVETFAVPVQLTISTMPKKKENKINK